MKIAQADKDYSIINGLGTITFSAGLIKQTIKQTLIEYPNYIYQNHSLSLIDNDYLEVSLDIKTPARFDLAIIERLQNDLLIVLKQSLSLTCVLAININYEK